MKKTYTKKQITEAIAYWQKQLREGNYKKLNESFSDDQILDADQLENLSQDDLLGIIGVSSIDDILDTELTIWYDTRDVDDFKEAEVPASEYVSSSKAQDILDNFSSYLGCELIQISAKDLRDAFYDYFESEAKKIIMKSGDFPREYYATGRWPWKTSQKALPDYLNPKGAAKRIFGGYKSAKFS